MFVKMKIFIKETRHNGLPLHFVSEITTL